MPSSTAVPGSKKRRRTPTSTAGGPHGSGSFPNAGQTTDDAMSGSPTVASKPAKRNPLRNRKRDIGKGLRDVRKRRQKAPKATPQDLADTAMGKATRRPSPPQSLGGIPTGSPSSPGANFPEGAKEYLTPQWESALPDSYQSLSKSLRRSAQQQVADDTGLIPYPPPPPPPEPAIAGQPKRATAVANKPSAKPAVAQRPPTVDEAMQGDMGPGVSMSAVDPDTRDLIDQMLGANTGLQQARRTNRQAAQGQYPSKESVSDIPTPEPNQGIQDATAQYRGRYQDAVNRANDAMTRVGRLREQGTGPLSDREIAEMQAQLGLDPSRPQMSTRVPVLDPIPGGDGMLGRELTHQPGTYATNQGFVDAPKPAPGSVRRDRSGTYIAGDDGEFQGRLTPEGRYMPGTREGQARQDAQRNRQRRRETPLAEAEATDPLQQYLHSQGVDTEGMTVGEARQEKNRIAEMLADRRRKEQLAEGLRRRGAVQGNEQMVSMAEQMLGVDTGAGADNEAAGTQPFQERDQAQASIENDPMKTGLYASVFEGDGYLHGGDSQQRAVNLYVEGKLTQDDLRNVSREMSRRQPAHERQPPEAIYRDLLKRAQALEGQEREGMEIMPDTEPLPWWNLDKMIQELFS